MNDKIINTLKIKLVAAELAKMGITDRAKVIAVAERTMVDDNGAIIGLKADGNFGVGTGPNFQLSVADVAADMGVHATETASHGQDEGKNPFKPGADFNITAQMVMLRNDPERADHLQYLAGIGK